MTIDPIQDWNSDLEEDLERGYWQGIVVYSRDWTVETIIGQIGKKNIDLNPKFQRRNAWNDAKRSLLIESLMTNMPVPEIVLAEDPNRPKAFIVLDGKQRLLTLAGFVAPGEYGYWVRPQLQGLALRSELNNVTYENLFSNDKFADDLRAFLNADIRCTVISNFKNPDILFDIFYRLNTGSVPLSAQELRQVLNKGVFADFLFEATNLSIPLHPILRLEEPDPRLRDIEVLLRFICFREFIGLYAGNMKRFLDDCMAKITVEWKNRELNVRADLQLFNGTCELMSVVFGDPERVGRKYVDGNWQPQFNKALFEVESFYFAKICSEGRSTTALNGEFLNKFKALCSTDPEFRRSIEATTKSKENYRIRFGKFEDLVNSVFSTQYADSKQLETN